MKKRISLSVLSCVLVVLIAVTALTGCTLGKTGAGSVVNEGDIGKGGTSFAFEVTDDKSVVTKFTVFTDEETVGAALLEVGLIEGDESDFGLYVKVVNGVKADYDADQAYWAFYVNGEFALSGVDTTEIEPGKIYAFIYTKA